MLTGFHSFFFSTALAELVEKEPQKLFFELWDALSQKRPARDKHLSAAVKLERQDQREKKVTSRWQPAVALFIAAAPLGLFFSLSVQKEDIANVRVFSLTSSGVECIVIESDHLSKCCFVFLCFSSLFDTTYSVVSLA